MGNRGSRSWNSSLFQTFSQVSPNAVRRVKILHNDTFRFICLSALVICSVARNKIPLPCPQVPLPSFGSRDLLDPNRAFPVEIIPKVDLEIPSWWDVPNSWVLLAMNKKDSWIASPKFRTAEVWKLVPMLHLTEDVTDRCAFRVFNETREECLEL